VSTPRIPSQDRTNPTRTPVPAARPVLPRPRVAGHDLLSVAQAAERLGTPERFIRRLVAQRRIRFYKVGRYIRFDATDLDTFIDTGRVEPWI
jgi:excisionase family DNA binding protein